MESLIIFFQAMLIGFAIAAPVGPIGILCIKRTLSGGFFAGLATGFGSAAAGATYGSIIAFGITAITTLLVSNMFLIKLVGGAVLVLLGVRELRMKVVLSSTNAGNNSSPVRLVSSAFLIAITNPMTLLGYLGLVPALAGEFCCTPTQATVMILGLFSGSMSWWITLSTLVSVVRHRLSANMLQTIGILSGLVLIGFGLFVFIGALVA